MIFRILKSFFIFGFLIVMMCSCNPNKVTVPLYIGTYTDGESEGIYKMMFNTANGALTDLQLVAKTENPSFIAFSPNKKNLFAVNEKGHGGVSSFTLEADGNLSFINTVESKGDAPCHITTNAAGTLAAVSNYSSGTLVLFNIASNGKLSDATQVFNHNTDSIVAHVHEAQFLNNQLFVADLGKNSIYLYQSDNLQTYQLKNPSIVNLLPNAGPRHFLISKAKSKLYIINELNSTITVANRENDAFKSIQNTATLNPNFKDKSYCAELQFSKNEDFLYASNRGENSIAVFKIDPQTGLLNHIENTSVQGNWPRHFIIDPSHNYVLVANQKSNSICVFKINQKTGGLTFIKDYHLASPVCLLF